MKNYKGTIEEKELKNESDQIKNKNQAEITEIELDLEELKKEVERLQDCVAERPHHNYTYICCTCTSM